MKIRKLSAVIAVVAVSFSGAAVMAQEITPDNLLQPLSTGLTRAQVLDELRQAQRDGTIHADDDGYIQPFHSTKTREQVRAETLAALRDGEVAEINAESFAFVPPHAIAPAPMRTAAK